MRRQHFYDELAPLTSNKYQDVDFKLTLIDELDLYRRKDYHVLLSPVIEIRDNTVCKHTTNLKVCKYTKILQV